MAADSKEWAELREFSTYKPSKLAFRALAALLDIWTGDDQKEAIDFAENFLETWPDSVRVAPWSWCKAVSRGFELPTWHLARTLNLEPKHEGKGFAALAKIAKDGGAEQITELVIPNFSEHRNLTCFYNVASKFAALKKLTAVDIYGDAKIRGMADLPLWQRLESFEINGLTESFVHHEPSRIVPEFTADNKIQHLTLRANDLIALFESGKLPKLRSVSVFIRSKKEAEELAARPELSKLASLSLAFRCGFSGSSPFEPSLGNVIEADDEAAEAFFNSAKLESLVHLRVFGYPVGYWCREGMGPRGLRALINSGLVCRLKHLRLELLPLGDRGVSMLAPELSERLETFELVDIYCKGEGAAALSSSPCLSSLRRLDLSANRIDSHNIAKLADADMPCLRHLDLSGPHVNPYYFDIGQQPILDAGAVAWAGSRNARNLEFLNLNNCFLSDEGLKAVIQSSSLQKLREIDLSHSSFTAEGVSIAFPDSPLWQRLEHLRLNDCRLDDDAIEEMTRVSEAPALRSVELGYNSIGPRGAGALANWPVLARLWHLNLHDNFIGDEGLVALAQSPNACKLLELDLEQDCWNSRTFDFKDDTAQNLANSTSFTRLEAIFSGCVDEYHGGAYSPGFSKEGLDVLRQSPNLRPAVWAACSDFSHIGEYMSSGEFAENCELDDHDFRSKPAKLNEEEAEPGSHSMQQIGTSHETRSTPLSDYKIGDLSKVDCELDDPDIIEGIEHRDAVAEIDQSLTLILNLQDKRHPLPSSVNMLLARTVDSLFRALDIGKFESGGSRSGKGDDGRLVTEELSFHVGINCDPIEAMAVMSEALWWIGAPEGTVLRPNVPFDLSVSEYTRPENIPLELGLAPRHPEPSNLQLACIKTASWSFKDEPQFRFDRVAFNEIKKKAIRSTLSKAGATDPDENGWIHAVTADGGKLEVFVKRLDTSPEFDALNILIHRLTAEATALIHRLMCDAELLMVPMAFAASQKVAKTIEAGWPEVTIVETAAELHQILAQGPYRWWNR